MSDKTKTITPLGLLTGMRELLTDPKKWTQGKYARTSEGYQVVPNSSTAVCFCLAGAALKQVGAEGMCDTIGSKVLNMLAEEYRMYPPAQRIQGAHTVWNWNDRPDTIHADVLKFLDTRIEAHLNAQQPS